MKNYQKTPLDPKSEYLQKVITTANIQTLAIETAKKALRTIHKKSLDPTIRKMYLGIIRDTKNATATNYSYSDGYDIVQTAMLFYYQYENKKLCDNSNVINTKTQQAFTIYVACLKTLNSYILREKNLSIFTKTGKAKTIYVDNLDNTLKAIPSKWDIETIRELEQIQNAIDNMTLTPNEHKVFCYRMQELGYKAIAKKMSISVSSVRTYLKRIQTECEKIGLTIENANRNKVFATQQKRTNKYFIASEQIRIAKANLYATNNVDPEITNPIQYTDIEQTKKAIAYDKLYFGKTYDPKTKHYAIAN